MEIFLPIINFELGLYTLLFLSLIVGVSCAACLELAEAFF